MWSQRCILRAFLGRNSLFGFDIDQIQLHGSTPSQLAMRRPKRGVFRCVVDLRATINRFVAETNHDPKPFTWLAEQHFTRIPRNRLVHRNAKLIQEPLTGRGVSRKALHLAEWN